jgi:hypothetical protein
VVSHGLRCAATRRLHHRGQRVSRALPLALSGGQAARRMLKKLVLSQ